MLDAGCGTGKYAKSLIDIGIGKISLLDDSLEMLNFAKESLKDAIETNVVNAAIQARLPDFPFEDGKFDAVMFNQVRSIFILRENIQYFRRQKKCIVSKQMIKLLQVYNKTQ